MLSIATLADRVPVLAWSFPPIFAVWRLEPKQTARLFVRPPLTELWGSNLQWDWSAVRGSFQSLIARTRRDRWPGQSPTPRFYWERSPGLIRETPPRRRVMASLSLTTHVSWIPMG